MTEILFLLFICSLITKIRESELPLLSDVRFGGLDIRPGHTDVGKQVIIFNIAAQTEPVALIFHAGDAHTALEAHGRLRIAEAAGWNGDNALQTLAELERLARNAIEAVAGKVFGGAFDRWHRRIAKQTNRPAQGYAFSLAAFFRDCHD